MREAEVKQGEFQTLDAMTRQVRASTSASLPPELVQGSVWRLQVLALLVAAFSALSFIVFTFVLEHSELTPVDAVCMPALFLLSLLIFSCSRWSVFPSTTLLNLGLLYQVSAALLMGLVMNEGPWPVDRMMPSWSPIAVWVVLFPTLVPAGWGKTLPVALLSAAMDPVSLWIAIELGAPPPAPEIVIARFVPNLPSAFIGTLLSGIIYGLGRSISEARRAGSYTLQERLGAGGMGEVWRARHGLLARPAVVKLIRSDVLASYDPDELEDARARFAREAQAIAALRSPHTVALYDYGLTQDGQFYYAMELLEGVDFERLVHRFGPLPAERVVYLLIQVCHSLAEAHAVGMVHRDIKPANLYNCRLGLECDFVKVLDFGLVKDQRQTAHADARLSQDGAVTGTPAYISPEVAASGEATPSADVYMIGCVAHWLLCGAPVFEAETTLAMLSKHVSEPPAAPSSRMELPIPSQLDALVLECLQKRPEERPADAIALRKRLRQIDLPRPWDGARAKAWWRTHFPQPEVQSAPSTHAHVS